MALNTSTLWPDECIQGFSPETAKPETDDDDIIDPIATCIIVHFITIVGSLGNVITLVVVYRLGLKDTTNIVLFSLAACDLFFLVSLSLRKLGCILTQFDRIMSRIYQAYIRCYIWMPGRLALNISLCQIVIIAIERFVAVYFPFKVSKWVTPKRMLVVLACVYVSYIALWSPWLFVFLEIRWEFVEEFNQTLPTAESTEFYIRNKTGIDFFSRYILSILVGPIYMGIVSASSISVAFKLKRISEKRLKMTARQSDNKVDVKISRMLLAVCAVFVIAGIPSFVSYMYLNQNPQIKPTSATYKFLFDVTENTFAVNSSASFILYTLMSSKFSKMLKEMFGC